MARTLKITRARSLAGMAVEWDVLLDGQMIGKLANGATITRQMSHDPHTLNIVLRNGLTHRVMAESIDTIQANVADCTVEASLQMHMRHNEIVTRLTYTSEHRSKAYFMSIIVDSVAAVFEQYEPVREIFESNYNRRHDLKLTCTRDCIKFEWVPAFGGGPSFDTMPYADMTVLPEEGVSDGMRIALQQQIDKRILATGRYVKNQYGAYEVKK